jgi:hypothetical protein
VKNASVFSICAIVKGLNMLANVSGFKLPIIGLCCCSLCFSAPVHQLQKRLGARVLLILCWLLQELGLHYGLQVCFWFAVFSMGGSCL